MSFLLSRHSHTAKTLSEADRLVEYGLIYHLGGLGTRLMMSYAADEGSFPRLAGVFSLLFFRKYM